MWSDRYIYYTIQSDLDAYQSVETDKMVKLLLDSGSFIQTDYQTFKNSDGFPWVAITIVMTENGSFMANNQSLKYVNLISIVCSKGSNVDQSVYTHSFLNIAERLNWKLFLEEDDSENENIEIVR